MKTLRQNLALAVDGGGIKGVMVARALERLEQEIGQPLRDRVRLVAGTSTGSILAAGIAVGMDIQTITQLYRDLGRRVFRKTWRNLPMIEYLVRYRYSSKSLVKALRQHLGDITLAELHQQKPDLHMVLTATDILANATRFIKLYQERYEDWRLRDVVLASSIIPTVFPVFKHTYKTMPGDPAEEAWIGEERWWVDGGVGSYENPSYMAAYEIQYCLSQWGWTPENTTLLSFGTGKSPEEIVWDKRLRISWLPFIKRKPKALVGPEWVMPAIDSFGLQAKLQQARLVRLFFPALDFRRFNIDFDEQIMPDQVRSIDKLVAYGEQLGEMVVNDQEEDIGEFGCGQPVAFGGP
jgi:patatin-like phospholipase/acyl hydrolase